MILLKKLPERTCMGCNAKKFKKDLIRVVKNKENQIIIDKTGKQEGRGTYICNNIECLEKAIKSKRMEKAFEMKFSEEVYENLKKLINGGEFIG